MNSVLIRCIDNKPNTFDYFLTVKTKNNFLFFLNYIDGYENYKISNVVIRGVYILMWKLNSKMYLTHRVLNKISV